MYAVWRSASGPVLCLFASSLRCIHEHEIYVILTIELIASVITIVHFSIYDA